MELTMHQTDGLMGELASVRTHRSLVKYTEQVYL